MTDTTENYSDQDISSMQERNEQTLSDIQNLQQIEQELYDSLSNNSLTSDQKDTIISRINEISQMRVNLYSNLKDMYSFFQKNVASSNTTLAEQMMAIEIVENELEESKRRLQLLEDDKNNKLRQVEINTYYGKKYNAHSGIMKTIVIMCVPILIVAILSNNGILPNNISGLLIAIIIIIGVISIGSQIIDLSNRDNMNFDEYNWAFNPNDAPTDNTSTLTSDPWAMPTLVCVGEQCCDEYSSYNADKNICIPNAVNNVYQNINSTNTTSSTTEGMANFSNGKSKSIFSNYSNYASF
jgi:hypothetical protein